VGYKQGLTTLDLQIIYAAFEFVIWIAPTEKNSCIGARPTVFLCRKWWRIM